MKYKKEVNVSAKVSTITQCDRSGKSRILLKDIYVNSIFFRDHAWVNFDKNIKVVNENDNITCYARRKKYGDGKVTLRGFRCVVVG